MSEELKIVILDAATGQVIERDFTADEVEEFEANQSAKLAEEEARTANRNSGLAKLAALGLTEEEIAAL